MPFAALQHGESPQRSHPVPPAGRCHQASRRLGRDCLGQAGCTAAAVAMVPSLAFTDSPGKNASHSLNSRRRQGEIPGAAPRPVAAGFALCPRVPASWRDQPPDQELGTRLSSSGPGSRSISLWLVVTRVASQSEHIRTQRARKEGGITIGTCCPWKQGELGKPEQQRWVGAAGREGNGASRSSRCCDRH